MLLTPVILLFLVPVKGSVLNEKISMDLPASYGAFIFAIGALLSRGEINCKRKFYTGKKNMIPLRNWIQIKI